MKSGMPWSIKVDDDARETALDAARRSGVTLSEWLRRAIAEHAGEEIPPASDSADDDDDDHEVEAVTEAVKRLVRRLKAMDADARLAISDLKERLDEIEITLGRVSGTGPGGGKSADSLKDVAVMVNRLARDLDDADETARSTVEGLPGTGKAEPMKASVTDGIRGLEARMAAMSARESAPLPPPRHPATIDELRNRLDALLAGGAEPPRPKASAARLESTLKGLETRIEQAKSQLGKPQDAKEQDGDAERVRRIEARLADIANRLAEAESARRSADAEPPDELAAAIAEIAARQVSPDEWADQPRDEPDRAVADALEALRADIAGLDQRLSTMARAGAKEDESLFSLARRIDALAAEVPLDRNLLIDIRQELDRLGSAADVRASEATNRDRQLEEIRRELASLGDSVQARANVPSVLAQTLMDDVRRELEALGASVEARASEASLLDRFDDLIHRLPDRGRLDALGEEVSSLRRALESDDSPRAVSRLEMRVNELARSIDIALSSRQSASEVAAAGMASTLADIRGALQDLAMRQPGGVGSVAMEGLAAEIAELRQMLDARDGVDRGGEDGAVHRLESRLDEIAAGIDFALSRVPGADLVDGLQQRLERLAAGIEALNLRVADPAVLDELKAEIAAVRNEIADREPPRLDYLESQIHDLAARIDAASQPDADGSQLAELEARITRLAGQLEQATPRTAALQKVEDNLMRLQASLSDGRRESIEAARAAARDAVREFAATGVEPGVLGALREDLGQVNKAIGASDARTEETIEGLQETLATIVDRLSRLEDETASEEQPAVLGATGTFGPEPAGPGRAMKAPAPQPAGEAPAAQRASERRQGRADLAALRELAASSAEAERKPVDRRADFIAAARRAADAAIAEADSGRREETTTEHKPSPFARIGQAIRNRKKPLLLAAAAIILAIGAIQIFGPQFSGSDDVAAKAEPPAVVKPDDKHAAASTSRAAMAPTVPRVDEPALVAPPSDARTAMALASVDTGAERFTGVFGNGDAGIDAGDRTGSIPPVSAAGAVGPNLPIVGSDKLRSAASAGDPAAAFEIGNRFAEGRGATKDLAAAVAWYSRAAEEGLAVGQYRLGSLYERGQGVARDFDEAVRWYQRAADQGNVGAMHNLAVLLSQGDDGTPPDMSKAVEWFLAAANYGVKDSQYNLGVIYARGLGPNTDLGEAYKWFAIAAAAGDGDAAARRDEVAAMLDADQLASARAVVQAWRAKPPLTDANIVKVPEGGWGDDADGITAADQKQLVVKIQSLLAEQGYDPGPPDGIEGPKTRDAVRAFQRTIGVAATGVIDGSLVTALSGDAAG
jgi:localization factor PodJL